MCHPDYLSVLKWACQLLIICNPDLQRFLICLLIIRLCSWPSISFDKPIIDYKNWSDYPNHCIVSEYQCSPCVQWEWLVNELCGVEWRPMWWSLCILCLPSCLEITLNDWVASCSDHQSAFMRHLIILSVWAAGLDHLASHTLMLLTDYNTSSQHCCYDSELVIYYQSLAGYRKWCTHDCVTKRLIHNQDTAKCKYYTLLFLLIIH